MIVEITEDDGAVRHHIVVVKCLGKLYEEYGDPQLVPGIWGRAVDTQEGEGSGNRQLQMWEWEAVGERRSSMQVLFIDYGDSSTSPSWAGKRTDPVTSGGKFGLGVITRAEPCLGDKEDIKVVLDDINLRSDLLYRQCLRTVSLEGRGSVLYFNLLRDAVEGKVDPHELGVRWWGQCYQTHLAVVMMREG